MEPCNDDDLGPDADSVQSRCKSRIHLQPHVGRAFRSLPRRVGAVHDRRPDDADRVQHVLVVHVVVITVPSVLPFGCGAVQVMQRPGRRPMKPERTRRDERSLVTVL